MLLVSLAHHSRTGIGFKVVNVSLAMRLEEVTRGTNEKRSSPMLGGRNVIERHKERERERERVNERKKALR